MVEFFRFEVETVVPWRTVPSDGMAPPVYRSASAREVLPAPRLDTSAIFLTGSMRISSIANPPY
jgi:hypothetical protein